MKAFTTSAWGYEYLEKTYDLSTPFESGLCGKIQADQCCKCLRKKKCLDVKCKDKFNGRGKELINIMSEVILRMNKKILLSLEMTVR